MRTLLRSLTGALLLFLAVQAFGPLLEGRWGDGARASMSGTCCCSRHTGALDGSPACSRTRHGSLRCGCGCQGQPADTLTAPAFGRVAVLPDQVSAFVDLAVTSLPSSLIAASASFTPIPPSPPPWRASTALVPCFRA